MAGNIRGITIELTADTKGITNSLKGVDKELKTTQSALKDVNKLLKVDPGNVDLLKQKQKDLKEAIVLTKDRLTELNKLQEQYGKGTKEYDAIQREIIETKQKLEDLEGQYKSFGSVAKQQMQAAGDKIKEFGDKVTEVGTAMSKYVTAPIVAGAGLSVAAWKDVDSAMDTLIVKTGATGDALAGMQDIVEGLATSMPVTFEDAATAVGEVSTRFDVSGQQLEDLSRAFLQFAAINGTDVNGSIDAVSAAMKAYGLNATSAGAALDILNTVGQNTGVSVDGLAGMMQTAAPVMQELGLSFDQAAVFLGNLDKNGIDASAVMTGLRTALKNATKDGKSMDQALADLESSLKNATSDTEAMELATELFGTKAGPAMLQALQDGRISFDDLGVSLQGFGGSVSETFDATQSPLDQLQANMNNLKLIGADLVNTAAPAISAAMDGLGKIINKAKDWWGGLSEAQQQNILKIAGVVAAIGPALAIGGKLITLIGGVVSALGMLMSPMGLIVAGIAAVIAAGVLLYTHWEDVKKWAASVGEWVSDKWNKAKEAVSNAVNAMKQKAAETWNSIKETAAEKTEAMKTMLTGKWDNIKSAYEKAGGGLKGVASAAVTAIKEYWTTGFDTINALTGGKLNAIKDKFTEIFNKVKTVVQNAINAVKNAFNFHWELPKLKLPHISVSGGVPPYGLGGSGSLPRFSIQWYKRAYDNPVLFQNPTVIPTSAGLKGFGDGAGAEIVMGLNRLQELVGASGDTIVNVYGSPGMDINELADAVQARLVALQKQREVAYA